jgi:hypothetical protein
MGSLGFRLGHGDQHEIPLVHQEVWDLQFFGALSEEKIGDFQGDFSMGTRDGNSWN